MNVRRSRWPDLCVCRQEWPYRLGMWYMEVRKRSIGELKEKNRFWYRENLGLDKFLSSWVSVIMVNSADIG